MELSELEEKLLSYELKRIGYFEAIYLLQPDTVKEPPENINVGLPANVRLPIINEAGEVIYEKKLEDLAVLTLKPVMDRVKEIVAAWKKSQPMPFDGSSGFRVLAEYNNVILAAKDITEYSRGFNFVTWQYNNERTGAEQGYYTEDYKTAKEDFAKRSGLIAEAKLFSPEQAAELKESLDYRIKNDGVEFAKEIMLKGIAEKLNKAYPEKKKKKKTA